MNSVPEISPRFLGLSPRKAAILLLVVTTLFRLLFARWLPLLPDEAYYFQWSKHLDASYFSKGPAIAYTIAAGTALFGDNSVGIRFFAVLLSAGTAWQVFLLARRWFDEVAGLLAVLLLSVMPLYAIGGVVMTIDPLSAFFWVWATNFFATAIDSHRMGDWILTGFAVGSGFLAKYLNALELIAFLLFLLIVPERRYLLRRAGFWIMLLVTAICASPVWWWNRRHGWSTVTQLEHRGELGKSFALHPQTFLDFLLAQGGLVVSPLIFLAMLATASRVAVGRGHAATKKEREGEVLLVLLFGVIFLFYAVLAWHMREEPNWPAISYLSLAILLAVHWKFYLARTPRPVFMILAFLLGGLQTLALHVAAFLPLPARLDPTSRVAGWSEIATRIETVSREQQADILITDGYKEAGIFSFYLPGKRFVYGLPHRPPANQFDFWPGYPTDAPHRALWITKEDSPAAVRGQFNTITPLERVTVAFRGKPIREYSIYRCENR